MSSYLSSFGVNKRHSVFSPVLLHWNFSLAFEGLGIIELIDSVLILIKTWTSCASQTWKSSRAWAPRDSFRAQADSMVIRALIIKFWSSRDSIRSVFQILKKLKSEQECFSLPFLCRRPSCSSCRRRLPGSSRNHPRGSRRFGTRRRYSA
jgi:pyruvate-formate lyase-activating enzyme